MKPRLLYVSSEDWHFLSHRLPMARAAREAGFEVHVATRVTEGAQAIEAEGFILHPTSFVRGRLSPRGLLKAVLTLRRIRKDVRPHLTHHVSLQQSIVGMLATFGRSSVCVNALTGLGYSFTSKDFKARVVKWIVVKLLFSVLGRRGTTVLVQNDDDFDALRSAGFRESSIAVIRGSGVDVDRLQPLPEPAGPPTAAFVGRLLDDKGIRTLVAAHRLLRERGQDVRLLIGGTPDPANPTSVTETEARSWNAEPGVEWLGQVDDIPGFWRRAHIAVLPSRREGLPLSLLEAAACGRAMVATDVPGCREIAIDGRTGVLVPPDNPVDLAGAIWRLLDQPALRSQFGEAARELVQSRFSADIVGRQTVAFYVHLLNRRNAKDQSAQAAIAAAATPHSRLKI